MTRVLGKVCIVTGTGSGIGRAIAQRLAEEGGRVLCVDIDEASVNTTVDDIRAAGGVAEAAVADIANPAQVTGFVESCIALWSRVDVLVNNAGVNLPGVFHEVTDEVIEQTLNVNVKGAIYAARAVIPQMLEQGAGSIVNISSVNGLVSEPFLTVYSASKGAVVMLTKGIALDYAKRGIRCNCICPGWVDTPINHAHAALMGGLERVYANIDSFQPIGRPG